MITYTDRVDQVFNSPPSSAPYILTTFSSGPLPSLTESMLNQLKLPSSLSSTPQPTSDAPMRDSMAFVLCCAPHGTLLSSELRERVWRLHEAFYKSNPGKWKTAINTIRHHLTNCPEFVKVGKPKVGRGRGQLWKYIPENKSGRAQRKNATVVVPGLIGMAVIPTQTPTPHPVTADPSRQVPSAYPYTSLSPPYISFSQQMGTHGSTDSPTSSIPPGLDGSPSTLSPASILGNPLTPSQYSIPDDISYATLPPSNPFECAGDPQQINDYWNLFVNEQDC